MVAQLPDAAGISGAEALAPVKVPATVKAAAPVKTAVAPLKAKVAPVKAAVAPVKAAVAPVKAAVAPVKAAVAPVKAAVAPVKAAVAPVKAAVAPVKAAVPPVSTPVQPPPVPIAPPPAIKPPSVPVPAPRVPSTPVTPPRAPVTPPTVTVKAPKLPAPAKAPAPAVKVPLPPAVKVPPAVQQVTGAAAEPVSTLPGPAPVTLTARDRTVTRAALARRSAPAAARAAAAGNPAGVLQGGAVAAIAGLSAVPGAAAGAGQAALTPRQIAKMLAGGRALLDHPRVRAFVLEVAGCLEALPPRLRTVVRLRTGLHEPRRLNALAVARRLHVSRKRLAAMEIRAVRLLWRAARTTGCAGKAASVARLEPVAFFGAPTDLAGGGAAGGVAGALYLKAPSKPDAAPVTPDAAVPAPRLQVPSSSDSPLIWVLVAVLAGSALVVYLVRQDMGLGALSARRRRKRGPGRDAGPDAD